MPRKRIRPKEKKFTDSALTSRLREIIARGDPWKDDDEDKMLPYAESHLADLIHGDYWEFVGESFPDPESRRAAWEELREEILLQHITHDPGSRPQAWWDYEAPEPCRRRVGGKGLMAYEDPESPAWAKKLSFGLPTITAGIDPHDPPRYESELEYLTRHNLLFKEEREVLRARSQARRKADGVEVGQ